MLDKMKDLGSQAATKANDAIGGISSSIKEGVGSFSTAASSMTESLNEKAVRASTAQVYRILEIAIEELKGRLAFEQAYIAHRECEYWNRSVGNANSFRFAARYE